jgi:hypothetical protein
MRELIERHTVRVGAKFCITDKLRTGIDERTGLPYWKFPVAMTENRDGGLVVYDYVWVRGQGKCPYTANEWFRITQINCYSSNNTRNLAGGKIIFHTLDCEFERIEKEKNYE